MVQKETDGRPKLLRSRRIFHLLERWKWMPQKSVGGIGSEKPQSLRARRKIQEFTEPLELRVVREPGVALSRQLVGGAYGLIQGGTDRHPILLGCRGILLLLCHYFVDRL